MTFISSYPGYSFPRTPDIHSLVPRIFIPSYPGYSFPRTPDIYNSVYLQFKLFNNLHLPLLHRYRETVLEQFTAVDYVPVLKNKTKQERLKDFYPCLNSLYHVATELRKLKGTPMFLRLRDHPITSGVSVLEDALLSYTSEYTEMSEFIAASHAQLCLPLLEHYRPQDTDDTTANNWITDAPTCLARYDVIQTLYFEGIVTR